MFAILTAVLLSGCGEKGDTGDLDQDGDGARVGEDCNDGDAGIFPGADEVCDEVDQDCDGQVDEAALDAPTWYADVDGDEYGDVGQPVTDCQQPPTAVPDATDCDDSDPGVNPTALEYCNSQDDDCDGRIDENAEDAVPWNIDADGDGFGVDATEERCPSEDGYAGFSDQSGDCDDANGAIYPGAEELCGDGIDNDCDGDGGLCELRGEEDLSQASLFLYGATSFNNVGEAASQGDMDGDGYPDMLLGARTLITGEDGYEVYTGAVYLVYGPLTATRSLDAAIDPTVLPEAQAAEYGRSVAVLGDVNGDGVADMLVSDPQWAGSFGQEKGAAWLFYGGERWAGERDTSAAPVRYQGNKEGDGLGTDVAAAGDLSGDGLADLLITAPGRDVGGHPDAGGVYVLYGGEAIPSVVHLVNPDASVRGGGDGERAGSSVSALGDNDGDGYADLLVGTADFEHPAYLIRGPITGEVELSEGAIAFTRESLGEAQTAVSDAGDIDGDGLNDILIGSPMGDGSAPGTAAGEAFLYYSGAGVLSGAVSLDAADAWFSGEGPDQRAGGAVGAVGDIDGDGLDDFAIGAEDYGESATTLRGAAYLFYGAVTGPIALGDADARMRGLIGDGAGHTLLGAGDLDGDGFGELWVGAPLSSAVQQEAGALYLLAGGAM